MVFAPCHLKSLHLFHHFRILVKAKRVINPGDVLSVNFGKDASSTEDTSSGTKRPSTYGADSEGPTKEARIDTSTALICSPLLPVFVPVLPPAGNLFNIGDSVSLMAGNLQQPYPFPRYGIPNIEKIPAGGSTGTKTGNKGLQMRAVEVSIRASFVGPSLSAPYVDGRLVPEEASSVKASDRKPLPKLTERTSPGFIIRFALTKIRNS